MIKTVLKVKGVEINTDTIHVGVEVEETGDSRPKKEFLTLVFNDLKVANQFRATLATSVETRYAMIRGLKETV